MGCSRSKFISIEHFPNSSTYQLENLYREYLKRTIEIDEFAYDPMTFIRDQHTEEETLEAIDKDLKKRSTDRIY